MQTLTGLHFDILTVVKSRLLLMEGGGEEVTAVFLEDCMIGFLRVKI